MCVKRAPMQCQRHASHMSFGLCSDVCCLQNGQKASSNLPLIGMDNNFFLLCHDCRKHNIMAWEHNLANCFTNLPSVYRIVENAMWQYVSYYRNDFVENAGQMACIQTPYMPHMNRHLYIPYKQPTAETCVGITSLIFIIMWYGKAAETHRNRCMINRGGKSNINRDESVQIFTHTAKIQSNESWNRITRTERIQPFPYSRYDCTLWLFLLLF